MVIGAYFDEAILLKIQTNMELASFAAKHHTLRVTTKAGGAQKGAYFLQLPYSLAVFYHAMLTLFNWMVGVVLFGSMINVTYLGDPGNALDLIYAVASSPLVSNVQVFVCVMCLLIPWIMIVAIPMVTQFKVRKGRLVLRPFRNENMPYPGVNSIAVSAACHPEPSEDDISSRLIKWGVVKEAYGMTEGGAGRCAFSAQAVLEPRDGLYYIGILQTVKKSGSSAGLPTSSISSTPSAPARPPRRRGGERRDFIRMINDDSGVGMDLGLRP